MTGASIDHIAAKLRVTLEHILSELDRAIELAEVAGHTELVKRLREARIFAQAELDNS